MYEPLLGFLYSIKSGHRNRPVSEWEVSSADPTAS